MQNFLMNFYSFEKLQSANMINIKRECNAVSIRKKLRSARTIGPGGVVFNFGSRYHFHC